MSNCTWCHFSDADEEYRLYEGEYWIIFLAQEQDYIGRCILVLKRHCGTLSALTENEWTDLFCMIQNVEACLKEVFGADLCNWSCLMNSFFKDAVPDPHVHIHVRPRYSHPVLIGGNVYTDDAFGHHYTKTAVQRPCREDFGEIIHQMKTWFHTVPKK